MAQILLLIVVKYFFSPYLVMNYFKNQECFIDLTCWTHNNLPNYVFMMQKGHIFALLQDLLLDGHPHSKVFYLTASPQNSKMRSDNCSHVRTPLT